ncbi:MAG TPA: SPFH domain-containing protein [Bacteroidales bacterium]|jgi:regulator of protease activity HflC (stomatin/prohibitin superfamily)|nr:SPFH domain-containing protein [Bacteroidales bacterium]HPB89576.1 SPFH domain-containing protein [Bacteroidales bacterium]HQA93335.1 SPFH domain-containing protein [Bacteroidales bacterium]HQN23597.1 SPFH domain-containing protein [Bacteroidales bacterium]HQP79439.1 SPFH domain-containing protein [Bacteroidales bacterium]
MKQVQEKFISPSNGWMMLFVSIIGMGVCIVVPAIFLSKGGSDWWGLLFVVSTIFFFLLSGLTIVNPNESKVVLFFGKYVGTIVDNGFFFVNPFTKRTTVSLRARNLNADPIKVNDKMGNPIMIGIVLVWRVKDTFKASFEVDNYVKFVDVQSEAAIRNLAGSYPYDNLEDEEAAITLRSGGEEVNDLLEKSLQDRLNIAGIEVMEARISYLAYAPEIASAMLQRQQATAIVAARHKIVEGAVSMVQMALQQLSDKEIIELDEEKKVAMVSNLMVVLTSDRAATPIVNAGSLY